MNDRILVVEDEVDIQEIVRYNLQQAGFEVETSLDGETALQLVRQTPPSLVVLDLLLPGIDGLEFCRLLKQDASTRELPVVMLTARADDVDRIVGLEVGADDYITKPFSPRELVLRVRAVLRRCQRARAEQGMQPELLQVGPITIRPGAHQAQLRGEHLRLTATEFKLLCALSEKQGRVQTREDLLAAAWGYTYAGYSRTVDTHVRRLREKLGPDSDMLETVRGVGYRLSKSGHRPSSERLST